MIILTSFTSNIFDSLKPVDASDPVSTFSSRYGLVWMHNTVGLFQPSWLILSASHTPNTAAFAIPLWPPYGPPSCPPFHVTPVTCALWQHSERTPCSGCHDNDLGGPQSAAHTHTHVHRHTRLHTAARKAIDILLYGGESWGGGWGDESCTAVSSLQRHRGN